MDGFDTLRERIREMSDITAESMISNAGQERQAILSEARAEAQQIEAEMDERLDRAEEERVVKKKALTRLEQRRNRLKAKQDLLQDTMAKALEALRAKGPEERKRLYDGWLKRAGASDETILIDKQDAPWFEDFLKEHYPGLQAELYDDVNGGFILRKGNTWQDFRFDHLLKQEETRYLQIAAKILFPEPEKEEKADA